MHIAAALLRIRVWMRGSVTVLHKTVQNSATCTNSSSEVRILPTIPAVLAGDSRMAWRLGHIELHLSLMVTSRLQLTA